MAAPKYDSYQGMPSGMPQRLVERAFRRCEGWRDSGPTGILICPIFSPEARVRGLKAKRVLITGGASGIGAATAARFLEEGSVVCILDRDAEARKKVERELSGLAGVIPADVSDLPQVQAAFAEATRVMGGVDVLINNAGISIRHNFLDITPDEWDKVIAVNLTGVFYVAQTAARHMMERGSGVILQTASTNGVMGYPYYADYNATKAGVIELTKSMALELAPKVRVCAVAPGYVLTPMQRAEYTDEMLAQVNQKIPLRRHAQPEEIAALFAFLASDDAANITGHVYTCDGGETAGGLASR
jgi:NAD(P)-dependent dehydrogenase (short-subunit alcohol dehydrogenase family)